MVEINIEFYGMKVEETHFETFVNMVNDFHIIKQIEISIPNIINKIFKAVYLCNGVKIPRSILAYAFEYYLSSVYRNKQQWIELKYKNPNSYNEDAFKIFVSHISNFIYVLKLSDEEYELHKKTFESFKNFELLQGEYTLCINEINNLSKEEQRARAEINHEHNMFKQFQQSLNNEECPITLHRIQHMYITKCGHKFERDALIEHLKNNNSCPLCREIL